MDNINDGCCDKQEEATSLTKCQSNISRENYCKLPPNWSCFLNQLELWRVHLHEPLGAVDDSLLVALPPPLTLRLLQPVLLRFGVLCPPFLQVPTNNHRESQEESQLTSVLLWSLHVINSYNLAVPFEPTLSTRQARVISVVTKPFNLSRDHKDSRKCIRLVAVHFRG